jgi:prevent-host-death family protein
MADTEWNVRSDELRRDLRHLLDSVEHEGAQVIVQRYDRPMAVIVPIDWRSAAAEAFSVISLMLEDKDGGGEWQSGMSKLAECLTRAGLPRYAALHDPDPSKEQDR